MLAISLLVHERPEVIRDQIDNICLFVPDSVIVLHINSQFFGDVTDVYRLAETNERVLINDQRTKIAWSDLIQAHNSNFHFLKKKIPDNYSHFCIHASNDMFLLPGTENYVRQHDCGVSKIETYDNMPWTPQHRSVHDTQLKEILNDINQTEIYGSQPEGTFYSRDLFAEIVKIIERRFDRSKIKPYFTKNDNDHNNTIYAREEIYYPTIAHKLCGKVASPYLYSEVMFCQSLSTQIIDNVLNRTLPPEYLTESRLSKTTIPLYDSEHLYAVKRVPRDIQSPVRKYVRELTERHRKNAEK